MSTNGFDLDQIKFSRSLVNPDKLVRDNTMASVRTYVQSVGSMEEIEMLKFWKALYYCMWLADKQMIQSELATSFTDLVDLFCSPELSMLYFRMFFRIILREWPQLDQHRINKVYSLIRVMFNKMVSFLINKSFADPVFDSFINILEAEVLSQNPNGVRFHISDIFWEEIFKASNGNIPANHFLRLSTPFLSLLTQRTEQTVIDRVSNAVFLRYLEEYVDSKSDNGTHVRRFHFVSPILLQKRLFDLAASDSTPEFARKRLYALHQQFASKSKVPFVSNEEYESAFQAQSSKISSDVEAGKSSKKRRILDDKIAAPVINSAKKQQYTSSVSQEKTVHEQKPRNPRQQNVEDEKQGSVVMKTKSAVKRDAILVETKMQSEKLDYIESKKFSGAKVGYVFHKVRYCFHEAVYYDVNTNRVNVVATKKN
jgi:ribosomal RNA-processing protein 1